MKNRIGAVGIALIAASLAVAHPASAQNAIQKCEASKPCSWGAHSLISAGLVEASEQAFDTPWIGVGVSMGWFVGREVYQRIEWGDRSDDLDQTMDIVSAAAGAVLWALWIEHREEEEPPLDLVLEPVTRTVTVGIKIEF